MDKVYVLTVNYRSESIIHHAIQSIDEKNLDIHILIIDNESTNKSYNTLSEIKDNRIEIIRSSKNLGFAGGNNYGFRYLQEKYGNINFIFLLNPDALATKNVILNLLEVMKQNNDYAAISPHIYDNKTKEDWFAGTMIDFENCKISNQPTLSNTENSIIDVFNGCAVLFDAKKFDEAGQFNEETFLYYDEANLSMNFLQHNYQCIYVPTLTVYHDVSSSTGNHSSLKSYYMMRNHIYFFQKYSKKTKFCSYKIPLINLLSAIKNLRFNSAYGICKAIVHVLMNKKGKQ